MSKPLSLATKEIDDNLLFKVFQYIPLKLSLPQLVTLNPAIWSLQININPLEAEPVSFVLQVVKYQLDQDQCHARFSPLFLDATPLDKLVFWAVLSAPID